MKSVMLSTNRTCSPVIANDVRALRVSKSSFVNTLPATASPNGMRIQFLTKYDAPLPGAGF